ncbi:hypothetical protein VN12_26270 [Pirellula sp. SH-Sr6A]|uniref:hyaluronate lyase N-terminal domain-containing protein n=1 Tax=Pirellula sp. SH-Sr6A TaxID=1632865 RepID=UPI00078C0132|nr:hypothetical protein [Pirellula sp. SH-Sr6A]AMV35625.1 hypothetical protein VN12_26270 [Pirellula sp. SH-Sr6A]
MKSIVISGGCASMVRRAPVVSKAIVEVLSDPAALSGTELRIQLRRDAATNWGGENPVLFEGELGVDTTSKNLKLGDGSSAWNDLPFLSVKPSDVSSAITAALASYTPTSSLAAVATSGSASDLVTGTLANARLSPQVVRSDFSYPDPAWITAIAASKLTGTIADSRLSSNVPLLNAAVNAFSGDLTASGNLSSANLTVSGIAAMGLAMRSDVRLYLSPTNTANHGIWIRNLAGQTGAPFRITDSGAVEAFSVSPAGNIYSTGTLQIGGTAGHILRWNAGASSLEVRDSTNAFYRKTRVGELQVVADLGGSTATPANARLGFLTQVGGYIAGAISARTYSANAAHGDIVISASVNMTTGQNDYSTQTDDIVLRGNTGNVEINRGLLSIGMPGQSARSLSILPVNTGDRTGVRVYDYGGFASASTQSSFEVTYLGGTFAAPSTTVSGHYRNLLSFRTGGATGVLSNVPSFAIRSTIGSVIGSSLSEVNTSMMVTSTATGLTIPVQTMFGNTGLVDFPIGQIQLGTAIRLKNNAGDLQVRNTADTDFGGFFAGAANFSNVVSASNGIKVSGTAGIQYSSVTPVATSGSIPWIVYTANSNALFTRDTINGRMFMTMTGGANSPSSNLQVHANAYVESGLFVSGGGGIVFANSTPAVVGGSHPWLAYTANSNAFYVRDVVNGRMQLTLAGGVDAVAAITTISSRLNVESHITSAFQSLSSDPSSLDIASGLSRLVKNTSSGEIAKFVNDGGVIKKAGSTVPGVTNLDGLSDVTVTGPTEGQVIRHNGTEFANHTPTSTTQIYDTPGTTVWVKPAGATRVTVICVSGGGGGGSGRRGPSGEASVGGGGGVAGSVGVRSYVASHLPGTVNLTIGTQAIGGAARTTDDTSGANGGHGGSAIFGDVGSPIRLAAGGGAGGTGGGAGTGGGSSGGTTANVIQNQSGEAASTTGGAANRAPLNTPQALGYLLTGGAAGGGITTSNVAGRGGHHTDQGVQAGWLGITAGTGGGAAGGGNGSDGPATIIETISEIGAMLGFGAGGGGGNTSGPGGNGGNALGYGCGGGGGGASRNGFTSGAGGNGGKAAIFIITEF